MDFFQQLLLAIIQALLEWLPVSSEGFIVLTAVNMFGETAESAVRFAIYFHLGTGVAVLIKYWRTYWDALFKDKTLLRLLILSVIGTAVVGIPVYLLLKESFGTFNGMIVTLFIGITLAVTGTLLRFGRLKATDTLQMGNRKVGDELALGFAQGFAILPGISRSGVTLTYLLLRGFKKEDAFKMSFVVSLPAIAGAIAFDVLFEDTALEINYTYIILMLIVAVIGFLSMEVLLRAARKLPFDVICYILSAITITLAVVFIIIEPSFS